eukprot:4351205-Prorocentrum_lima.AAC.1
MQSTVASRGTSAEQRPRGCVRGHARQRDPRAQESETRACIPVYVSDSVRDTRHSQQADN